MTTTENYYPGQYTSAIARAKRILTSAGFPWSVTKGRYQPFFNTQKTTDGVKVTRVGCSSTIALHVRWHDYRPSEERRLIEALAIATLRDQGLPFADNGFLDCDPTGVY